MLYDTLETCAAVLSLICMFVTLVCIVLGVKRNCIPTFVAISGCILYTVFLTLAKSEMNINQQHTYSSLLLGFVLFAIIAYATYFDSKKKKQQYKKKFKEFKRECFEARNGVLVIEA